MRQKYYCQAKTYLLFKGHNSAKNHLTGKPVKYAQVFEVPKYAQVLEVPIYPINA
jgi:hypothetical protein